MRDQQCWRQGDEEGQSGVEWISGRGWEGWNGAGGGVAGLDEVVDGAVGICCFGGGSGDELPVTRVRWLETRNGA